MGPKRELTRLAALTCAAKVLEEPRELLAGDARVEHWLVVLVATGV